MKKQYTCIICPNGCEIEAEWDNGKILSVVGHTCPKGEQYVRQELTAPKRTIASSILVENGVLPLASVRLTAPIPKEMIFPVMEQIRQITLRAPVKAGTVVCRHVCGLESDVVVTKNVEERKQEE
ncbi:DUF1667 domain-containing protein [Agathobaculum sp. NSJ-28]|uniref:DUF1667 domain-containing protein n=2 Tax=Agathobaculum TaxID=2048137 RepID=A0A923LXN1_9FIRM|nr:MULTISPECIES: DUF1667 domain-containing protein [Butyricicoccaceae]MBS6883194.1 DUF1667 domain-containing protein [Clostridiaceae bacterium]SCI49224.1 Uncharacterized protein with conserved CXXC pairs [uncultured Butyricicoccus sp.]MBC5725827.1 DUF1667 domain-containing protein [Agathobaculum faecis]MCU6787895.1 DUF1667 domain-containing protein [Agathobaculum ammoniilyticum]WOC75090.1 DUF1667 domain-containing protein [Intestinibacillus sp. NTUH-41-i26]